MPYALAPSRARCCATCSPGSVPALVFFGLWYFVIRRMAERSGGGRLGRLHGDRQEPRQGLRRDRHRRELRRRGRRRRGQGRPEGSGRLPPAPAGVRPARRAHPEGRAAGRPAGHGKTLLAAGGGRRGRRALLSRSRAASSSRCSSASARRACATSSSRRAPRRRPSSSSTSSMRSAARVAPSPAWAGTTKGADAQPAAGRDGWLRHLLGPDHLAATNRPEILDTALLRAGRFDRQVLVDRPDRKGRLEILKSAFGQGEAGRRREARRGGGITAGFSGADLANLVNEAAIAATRRHAQEVTLADFTAAVERIVAGLERRSRVLNAGERRAVALHEMGPCPGGAGAAGQRPSAQGVHHPARHRRARLPLQRPPKTAT